MLYFWLHEGLSTLRPRSSTRSQSLEVTLPTLQQCRWRLLNTLSLPRSTHVSLELKTDGFTTHTVGIANPVLVDAHTGVFAQTVLT